MQNTPKLDMKLIISGVIAFVVLTAIFTAGLYLLVGVDLLFSFVIATWLGGVGAVLGILWFNAHKIGENQKK